VSDIVQWKPLYKRDTTGKVRVWFMERQGAQYRTVAGVKGGTLVYSDWRVAEATNVGRSNERNPEEQANFEVNANYEYQLAREYHESEAEIDKPKFFKPMLAHKYEAFKPGYAQPKLDGVRCIAKVDGLFSREGKPILAVPHISAALEPLFAADPDLILDGELYNHDLKDDFNEIISLVRKAKPCQEHFDKTAAAVQYHVYDMPSHSGGFVDRYKQLARLGYCAKWFHVSAGEAISEGAIHLVPAKRVATVEEFGDIYGSYIEAGFEGGMWRCGQTQYQQKRSKALLKRKDFEEDEFDVVRIEEGKGNWAGAAKRVVCWLPGADRSAGPSKYNTFEAGIRGTRARGQELLGENHKVVSVRFFGYTSSEIPKPRFGVVTKFWGEGRDL